MHELPLTDLKNLGLIDSSDDLTIDREDLDAILAGRLSKLLHMTNLEASGSRIDQLDAKLSLYREPDGKVAFRLHPIYHEPVIPSLLDDEEAEALINGNEQSVVKTLPGPGKKELVFEYDADTRAFISYDPARLIAPDQINGYPLQDWQKDDFKKGYKIELPDGTALHHRATDPKGIRADRAALIFSVLIDGGVSYLLLRGIHHLANNSKPQEEGLTPAFQKAYADMEKYFAAKGKTTATNNEENRGYLKTRAR